MSSTWTSISRKISLFSKKKSVKYGIPFMVLILGGSLGLKEFAQLRYTFSKKHILSREEMEELGVGLKPKEEVTLETAYEEIKEMDIDNWHNIRGPRPWEEPSPELVEMRNKRKT